MIPGDRPLRALADQLATLVPPADRLRTAEDLAQRLASQTDTLRGAVHTLTADQPGTFVLVVDQLEELFTHAGAAGQPGPRGPARCHRPPGPGGGRFPGEGAGGNHPQGCVPGAGRTLPLLEHALYELWRARSGAWLTLSAYEASGGVAGALQRRAQACYEALKPEEREMARQLFLRLTSLGEGTPDTRRRVARGELTFPGVASEQVERVLGLLSGPETRLIVADGDTVEVAHEVLIWEWPTLRRWLDENRRELRVLRRLTEAANEWEKQQRDPSYLYTGARLLEAEERFAKNPGPLNQRERGFLRASMELRDTERREEEKRRQQELETKAIAARRLKMLALVLAVAVIGVFGVFGFWRQAQTERDLAQRKQKQAQQERDNARSRELTAKAVLRLKDEPQRSLRDIQEAWRVAPNEDLAGALSAWRFEPVLAGLRGHSNPVWTAAFSPDGSRIVTASMDKTARVWDASSGELLSTLSGHFSNVETAAFSPDGSRIVTASQDSTARIWSCWIWVPVEFQVSQASQLEAGRMPTCAPLVGEQP